MADPRNNRKKRAARVLAIVLSVCMVLMLMSYIFMIFSYGTETAFVTVAYAEDLDDSKTASDRYKFLHDVLEFVHENYADKLSYDDLVNAAYKGVFDSLDDFSEYYIDSAGADATANALASEYEGVGITIITDTRGGRIISVNPEGPAYEAGIKPQGVITAVDGTGVAGKNTEDIASMMRGTAGTTVTITIDYDGSSRNYTLTRRKLALISVFSEMMDGNVGYIRISDIAQKTPEEFADARVKLLAEGAKGLILDLRDNGGGYMAQAEKIAEMLLDEGIITRYIQQGKETYSNEAFPDNTKKVPIVVLTNEYTASAAEMLTAALHDNGAAQTVGTTTYGKGVGQSVFTLKNGDSLKLTMFHFVTPKGVDFDGKGLKPDYLVYNSGTLTAEGREYAAKNVISLALDQKYFAGQTGLNVLAAQQRLYLLGYNVTPNGQMDSRTVDAVKDLQKKAGGKPYGGLDFFTLKALNQAYADLVNATGTSADAQLAKALELLK
ncbi:MAG: S41 family peptidase [Firmicutes bacterium]|nr:S41 family peptidase [Bacillota bacterium]